MAQLNATVDKIQLTTNMITSGDTTTEWSDTKYPSAKAVANKLSTAASSYPIGSVIMTHKELSTGETSAAANPAMLLGLPGTWTLIDKEFINKSDSITSLWTANRASASGYISWADHAICLKMWLVTDGNPLSAGNAIGNIDLTKAGVTSLSFSTEGGVAFATSGTTNTTSYIIKYKLDGGGYLSLDDIYDETVAAIAGATIHIQTIIPISWGSMLDKACDKFYWKRTA